MIKVMTLVGTRPELIKMSRVIHELDKHTDHVLVHSGQNYDYELNQIFFDSLDIRKPDYFLGVSGDSAAVVIAEVIAATDRILVSEQPDAFLVYGDTNTGMGIIAAKRRKIPVFHMEAGNRCFDQRVPEELNRKVLDHLSDINMVLTEHARRYLLAEGIRPETIIKTGSHMHEVLNFYRPLVRKSEILKELQLNEDSFFLVSAHREENVDSYSNLSRLLETLQSLAEEYEIPVVVSTHPRTGKRLGELGCATENPLIRFLKPFGFSDYIRLQLAARCVLSDSGTLTEEASLLNLPAVAIRNTHERPEGMDEGTLVLAGLSPERVLEAVRLVLSTHDRKKRVCTVIPDYQPQAVSQKIVRTVLSYTEYVNRTVWHKGEV